MSIGLCAPLSLLRNELVHMFYMWFVSYKEKVSTYFLQFVLSLTINVGSSYGGFRLESYVSVDINCDIFLFQTVT